MWGWGAHTPMELYNIYHTDEALGTAQYSPYSNETVDAYIGAGPGKLRPGGVLLSCWKKPRWDGGTGASGIGDAPWIWLVNVDHLYWVRDGLNTGEQKIQPTATAGLL